MKQNYENSLAVCCISEHDGGDLHRCHSHLLSRDVDFHATRIHSNVHIVSYSRNVHTYIFVYIIPTSVHLLN